MPRQIFTLLLSFLALSFTTNAQMMQFRIGGPGNEIATRVRYNYTDQSVVIAGYTYDYSGTSASNCQAIVMKVLFGGTIVWQKTFGVSGKNNLIQDMIITEDGNIVVVGTVGGTGAVFADNTAAIIKYDSHDGHVIWQKCLRDAATTTGGELFFAVTELTDGTHRLVAAGGHNFTGSGAGSMVCVFTSDGTLMYNEVFEVANGDEFVGITTNAAGDGVYLAGVFVGTYKDGRVMSYTPGTTSGTVNWTKCFNFILQGALSNNFFNSIYLTDDNTLVINGSCLNGYSTTNGSGHFLLTMNTDGTGAKIRGIQNSSAFNANSPRIAPLSSEHIYTIQSPSPDFYDPTLHTTGISTNTVVNEITSVTSSTANPPVIFKSAEPGLHSFLDMRYHSGYLFLAGATNIASGFGQNDIYYVLTAPTLSSVNANCDTLHADISITTPTFTNPVPAFTTYNFTPVYSTVDTGSTSFSLFQLCGDSGGDVPPPPPPTFANNAVAPSGVSIYPNPFAGTLTVTAPKIESLVISNIVGQVVYNFINSTNSTLTELNINTANFRSGMYFININNSEVKKIIK